ncbi:hypothetical protein [Maribacter sp. R77961]|uniref:hypothetical protein n=1 Tax=Maribacter sp. R77961 TaxID=3093871 RepID=UPI0037CB4D37
MNIIEEISKKYGGNYAEERTKKVSTPNGQNIYQPKKGILEIDGTKISLNSNEVGGAMPVTEPLRVILYLDKIYNTELTIFPKDLWNDFLDFIMPKRRDFIPPPLRKQFWFGGDKTLLKKLATDKILIENLLNERVYIETKSKETDWIILTPEYGIENIKQFEKFVIILKRIEEKIKTAGNNTYN